MFDILTEATEFPIKFLLVSFSIQSIEKFRPKSWRACVTFINPRVTTFFMSGNQNIEGMLSNFDHKSSLRGTVVQVEELPDPSESFVIINFQEQRRSPQQDYVPLEKEFGRQFSLDVAEAAGVAFSGSYAQFDVYTKGQYIASTLRKVDLPPGDESWKEEVLRGIDEFQDDE